jgi:hypothetical protein
MLRTWCAIMLRTWCAIILEPDSLVTENLIHCYIATLMCYYAGNLMHSYVGEVTCMIFRFYHTQRFQRLLLLQAVVSHSITTNILLI